MDKKALLQNTISVSINGCEKQIKKMEADVAYHEHNKDYAPIKFTKTLIKIIKVERLIYLACEKGGKILNMYCDKYQELLSESYEESANLVKGGELPETAHLDWCADSLKRQQYIKRVCDHFKN